MGKNQNDKSRMTAVHAVATGEAVPLSRVPDAVFAEKVLGDGIAILDMLTATSIMPSKSEGRRLIQQGGLTLNEEKVTAIDRVLTIADFAEDYAVVKCGKKKFFRVNLV